MGRQASISIEHVQTAIEALRAEGKNVSSRSVREKLGNIGSMGTVNKLLQQCLSDKVDEPSSLRQLPSELQHAIFSYADLQAETARAQIANELVHCKHEMIDLSDDNEHLTEAITNLQRQVDLLVVGATETQGKTAQLLVELDNARQESVMERRAAELARIDLAKLQARTEQLAPLADEVRDARVQINTAREEYMQSQQQAAILEIQKKSLETVNQALSNELAEAKDAGKTLSDRLEKLSAVLEQERTARALVERELAVKIAVRTNQRSRDGEHKHRTPRSSRDQNLVK